ncbi:MAG: hypothetical protein HYZ28_02145 [Myxococcales bacterium]|nr:hypothetical protein [Myxococcales bacterium]
MAIIQPKGRDQGEAPHPNPPQRPAGMQAMGEEIYREIRQLVRELASHRRRTAEG